MLFWRLILHSKIQRLVRRMLQILWSKKSYKFLVKDWVALTDLKSCAAVLHTMRFSRNLQPIQLEAPAGRRILVIAPHPDDEILGAGGTIIKAIAAKSSVHVLYLTSGRPFISEFLEQETLAVAKRLGYYTDFLRFPLGEIPLEAAAKALAEKINLLKPDLLFLPVLFDDHDDHRRASHILLCSQLDGFIFNNPEIWGYQVYTSLLPNVVVDISDVVDQKSHTISMWKTQEKSRDWAHYILGLNAYNVRFLATAKPRWAEAFFVLPMKEYMELCKIYFSNNPHLAYTLPYYTKQ